MKERIMRVVGVICLAVAVGMLSMTGCGAEGASTADGKTKIVLNEVAHSIFYAPMYVAIEEGYFTEEGIELELVTGFGADKTMTAVLTGEADIGFMGSESTVYTYAGGTQDYVVNFAQLTQRAGNFLVSREPLEEFSWDMLVGKDVLGGRAGGMPEMVFEYILEKNGIDPNTEVRIDQSVDFGSTAAAFSGGDADFTVEFEPHATMLEQKGEGYVVASLGEDSGYVPYTSFSAKKSYLEEHGDIIQAFTDALQKGMDYVQSHSPEEIAPHPFLLRLSLHLLLTFDLGGEGAGHDRHHQHHHGGGKALRPDQVKCPVGVGKGKIHRQHADKRGDNPPEVPLGSPGHKIHAQHENHGSHGLGIEQPPQNQVHGKGQHQNQNHPAAIQNHSLF